MTCNTRHFEKMVQKPASLGPQGEDELHVFSFQHAWEHWVACACGLEMFTMAE